MDSTQDINKIDQVSVVIRYVVLNYELRTLKIEESFLGFLQLINMEPKILKNY